MDGQPDALADDSDVDSASCRNPENAGGKEAGRTNPQGARTNAVADEALGRLWVSEHEERYAHGDKTADDAKQWI